MPDKDLPAEPTGPPELPAPSDKPVQIAPADSAEQTDPEADRAVDDIIAQESDELLKAEDEQQAANSQPPAGLAGRIKHFVMGWLRNSSRRRLIVTGLALGLLVAAVVPASRYFILNSLSVRSRASVVVLDDSTQQPLKNVQVTLGSQTALTDIEGRASFYHVRLGPAKLSLSKRAFASESQTVTIGWGSNPLESMDLRPIGSQYRFTITDYLSAKPLAGAEAVSGDASAVSNEAGEIVLTLDIKDETQAAETAVKLSGYRTEELSLDLSRNEPIKLELVPAKAHLFISKRSGRYDVYKIDADGKNEEKILAGSGIERDDMALAPHPTRPFAALVSTRQNITRGGVLLSTLTLIDIAEKTPTKITQSERIQIIDWIGGRLVYVRIASGASAVNPKRHRLMSYDLKTGKSTQLAAANYFNDVLSASGRIFYAPSATYAGKAVSFYRIDADGSDRQAVLNREVWNIFRTDYDKLVLAVGQDWYNYSINSNRITSLNSEPDGLKSRVYWPGPNGKQSLWTDKRSGKGVLLLYDHSDRTDKTIFSQAGLGQPLQWLSHNAAVFRLSIGDETADYAISLDGGEPKKIKDVANTSGIERWYYY